MTTLASDTKDHEDTHPRSISKCTGALWNQRLDSCRHMTRTTYVLHIVNML